LPLKKEACSLTVGFRSGDNWGLSSSRINIRKFSLELFRPFSLLVRSVNEGVFTPSEEGAKYAKYGTNRAKRF
jgi:hypothetical protein